MKVASSHPTQVRTIVQALRAQVRALEVLFPGRPFTLDGHLVGSIGEVLAAERYGLTLLPPSAEAHDASTADGKRVQIKLTQGKSVALRSNCDHLIVLRLNEAGEAEEIFNGPGAIVWAAVGKMQKNGQRAISIVKLKRLMERVAPADRILQAEDS
jgi:Family of unknown function (DUF6998)